ncbi:transcription factor SPT20 homolog isoform X2 [Mya arenaria]|uniref:transcription factor SPT20 homolog isoform X2 n=1 Tax=Mya arenaria TaxID=6604 RepID=UPI0022E55370|nr:transcription factor SPT20 homolog isoform X2 [Mya arenaria]
MNSFERAVDYAEYLVELGRQNPAALVKNPPSASSKGKSIHQKLLDLYIEETGKQQDDQKLQCNTHLLRKLVRREKLNCLILNLYPGNEGYSLMLRSKAGIETETCKLPYEVTELLDYIDDSELPPFLVDVLEKAQVNVFYSGCVIVEIRDFRRATNGTFDMQYVLLKPNPQTLLCDINNLTSDGHVWTQEDLYMLEGKLLLATEEPLCLDPSPAVALVANRQQYDRNKLNTPQLKRPVKKYTQAAMNRKRKFALSSAPRELQLHEFIAKKKEKKTSAAAKLGKACVDFWKQKAVSLVPPDSVDVDKFARVMDKPDKRLIMENSLALVEEQVLERDGVQDKKLLAKLTIYHRPLDDAHIGELYLDHDYVEDKSKGATCRFLLGNKDSVRKYLDQFREIFTEEGRRAVKITTQRPGQPPQVTCTQTTPTNLPVTSVPGSVSGAKTSTSSTQQAMEVSPVAGMGGVGMKRTMPIQLALSIGPTGTPNPPGQAVFTQQATPNQAPNQIQLSMPTNLNQSPVGGMRLPLQIASQPQSASQRLKQLGIHTSIAPSASPSTQQPPIAQLFGSQPGQTPTMLAQQPGLSPQIAQGGRTPSHTPTPTPPPPIMSPPTQLGRKSSLTAESSTIHHMAQTAHQTNHASLVQASSTPTVSHPQQQQQQQQQQQAAPQGGVVNINLGNSSNITGIPPNINIQNLTGLPGMNIANLQGLQNMQVSLSVHGGLAVPISMISANHQGIIVSSAGAHQNSQGGTPSMQGHQQGQTSVVTMTTHHLVNTSTSTVTSVPVSHVVTGVISQGGSNVMSGTGMLSVPINLGPGLVQQGLKSAGQIRASSSMPLQLQFGQQGIQFVNLQQQRTTLKPGAGLQPGQTLGTMGVRPSTSIQGPLTTTILSNPGLSGGQQVLSHLSLQGKPGPGGGITTTLTPQQLVQLQPQFQIQQTFQRSGLQQATGQPTQQLQFHQILKQQPPQSPMTFGGKPKAKKRTTPTPPKQ